jgi:hypothetical protein
MLRRHELLDELVDYAELVGGVAVVIFLLSCAERPE